jgi:hypothetical protein
MAISVADIGRITLGELFPNVDKSNYRYPEIKICSNQGQIIFSRASSPDGFPTGEEEFYLSELYYGSPELICDEKIEFTIEPIESLNIGEKILFNRIGNEGFRLSEDTGERVTFIREETNAGMYFGKNMDGYSQSINIIVGIKNGVVLNVKYTADFYM